MEEPTQGIKFRLFDDLNDQTPLSKEMRLRIQSLKEEFCRQIGGHVWTNRHKGRWRCFICQKVRRVRPKRRGKLQGAKASAVIVDEVVGE